MASKAIECLPFLSLSLSLSVPASHINHFRIKIISCRYLPSIHTVSTKAQTPETTPLPTLIHLYPLTSPPPPPSTSAHHSNPPVFTPLLPHQIIISHSPSHETDTPSLSPPTRPHGPQPPTLTTKTPPHPATSADSVPPSLAPNHHSPSHETDTHPLPFPQPYISDALDTAGY